MTVIDIYRAQYEEQSSWYEDKWSKYTWAARSVFDLTTYDPALDEMFVKDILEVCKVILNRENYEYIKDEKNYIKYILVCQILEKFNWLGWGTSIRTAWFNFDSDSERILEELTWCDYDEKYTPHSIDPVLPTEENIKALIEFVEE